MTTLSYLGEAYFQTGRSTEAREIYRQVLEYEPDNVPARMALARILVDEDSLVGALTRLDEVIRIQPSFAKAHEMKGLILYEKGRFQAALPPLRRVLELDQRNPNVHAWIGFCHLGLQQWEEALRQFEVVVEQDPENGDAYLGVARAQLRLRRLDEAEAALARAEELGTRQSNLGRVKKSIANARARQARRAEEGE